MGLRSRIVLSGLASMVVFPTFAGGKLVISQIYASGGEMGAIYRKDFIEIRNIGDEEVDVSGWSVQYAPPAGTNWEVTPLGQCRISPGAAFLVQEAGGKGGVLELPRPDAKGQIQLNASSGKVILASTVQAQSGSKPAGFQVVDFVGYGNAADAFEGRGAAPTLGTCVAALRKANGTQATGDNAADFIAAPPFGGAGDREMVAAVGSADDTKPDSVGKHLRPDECRERPKSRPSRSETDAQRNSLDQKNEK